MLTLTLEAEALTGAGEPTVGHFYLVEGRALNVPHDADPWMVPVYDVTVSER
jgi:hypothetical protein